MADRKTSPDGRLFISTFEGVVLRAYPDPATGGKPWTIGVGHTSAAGKPVVAKGMTISRDQAFEILASDLLAFDAYVCRAVKRQVSQPQHDALSSLCFNIGPAAFSGSSVVRLLNRGDMLGAAGAFGLWNKAAGKVMSGLVRRRAAERLLFETGRYGVEVAADGADHVGTVLKLGSPHPEGVRALQLDLIALGLLPADADDGDFGPETDKAVRTFQADHALAIDGRAGPATRAAIAGELTRRKLKGAVAMFPLKGQALDMPVAA